MLCCVVLVSIRVGCIKSQWGRRYYRIYIDMFVSPTGTELLNPVLIAFFAFTPPWAI